MSLIDNFMFYGVLFLTENFSLVETKLEDSADPDEISHSANILVNVLIYRFPI